MAQKKIQVFQLHLDPVLDARVEDLAGFYVAGFKRKDGNSGRKVGFLISGIRLVSIQNAGRIRFRVRIKFMNTGFEVREEFHPSAASQRKNSVFMVSFSDWEPVIVQGEPTMNTNMRSFQGQIVQVTWNQNGVVIVPIAKGAKFITTLNTKLRKIEMVVS
ncbi:MAG: hypothetical protein ACFFCZ_10560 [Promethearchaeota archaeon]